MTAAQRGTTVGYTRTAVALHWGSAACIACAFGLGLTVSELPFSPQKLRLEAYHKWLGITVLALVMLRTAWRLGHRPPPLPAMPAWQGFAARLSHGLMYALMLTIPLAGWTFSSASGYPVVYLGLWRLPDLVPKNKFLAQSLIEVHARLAWLLFYLLLLHAAAALKHHFLDRDDTLLRMLLRRRSGAAMEKQT